MPTDKPKAKPGPKEARVVIPGKWEDAVRKALGAGKPPAKPGPSNPPPAPKK